jgi:hypothetical protein
MLQMLRTACGAVVVVTAGVLAGVATGKHGTSNPGLPKLEQPGVGAVLVGTATALLVLVAMSGASAVRRHRRRPNATFSTRYEHGLTAAQYLRRQAVLAAILVAIACLGIWLRHRYG